MKVVFHVDELAKWQEARHNIKNLLAASKGEIVLTVNGEAILGFLLPVNQAFIKENPAVAFHACQNAMRAHQVKDTQLPPEVLIVPAGVFDLITLQQTGFAYIKP